MTRLLIFYLIALAVSAVLTPLCRFIAQRSGYVAKPKEDRWHKRPTALFGGIAIAVTTLGLGAFVAEGLRLWELLACGLGIAAFGLVDDILSLKASTKLIVQIALASALLSFGFRLPWTGSLVGDSMLTLFWIVGITNSFNLLDNMDGLCAGTTLIAGLFLLLGLYNQVGLTPSGLYLAVLLGATSGFLIYNVHPASIFMGDTGSLFLGLNLAALTLLAGEYGAGTSRFVSVMAGPVLLLLIPIFDTTLVTVMRLLAGRRPSQGGRDHTSHRLVAIGLPEPTAVAVLWALAVFGGCIALSMQLKNQTWTWIPALAFFIAMTVFAVYLARIRVYEDVDPSKGPIAGLTPVVANFMYKTRVAEVLLDLCLTPLAYYSAYRLRFGDAHTFLLNYRYFVQSLPIVVASQMIALFIVGGYRGAWRYFDMRDAVVFSKSVLMGTATSIVTIVFVYHFDQYSRGVFVIHSALLLLMLAGTRGSFRLVGEFVSRRRAGGQRCVIYGTTGASVATIREAFHDRPTRVIGFVDDDPMKLHSRLSGLSVLGDFAHLESMIESGEVDCIVINTQVANVERLQALEASCRARQISLVRIQVGLKPFHVA
jgi:UDP-GlcNAc:undecaprenyl-phosphate GlcNAc-1-phosphate transferase